MNTCHELKKLLKDVPKEAVVFLTGRVMPYRAKRAKRSLKRDIRFYTPENTRGIFFKKSVVFVAFSEINKKDMIAASMFTAKILCFPPLKPNPIILSYNEMIDTVSFDELTKNLSTLTIELESYQEHNQVSNEERYYGYGLIQHLEQLDD